jgi:hypothetical protein
VSGRVFCGLCGRKSCDCRARQLREQRVERERREDSRFLRTVGVFLELLRTDARLDPEAAMTKAARATAARPS